MLQVFADIITIIPLSIWRLHLVSKPDMQKRTGSIKFGVSIGQERVTWPELREACQVIEDIGFDSIWTHDHFIPSDQGLSEGPCLEGWTLLSAMAVMTREIRIGCMVSGNTYRHPAVLAKMAATVDIISGGRLNFGIGAGWFELEHAAYGIPFYTVGERISRLEEAVQIVRLLWDSDGPVDFQGEYYTLKDAPFDPKPLQNPHPPILIGGGGEKRTLRISAEWADAVNILGKPEVTGHKLRVLEQHCKDVGRDPNEIEKTVQARLIPPDQMAPWNQYIDNLRKTNPAGAEDMARMTVEGTEQSLMDFTRTQVDLGMDHIMFSMRSPYPFDILNTFSQQVMPEFR